MKKILLLTLLIIITNAYAQNTNPNPPDLQIIEYVYHDHIDERKMAYDFFRKEAGDYLMSHIELEDIGISFFDLNDNGEKEMFVYVNGNGSCPTNGCPFAIFQKYKGKYKPILWSENLASLITHNNPRIVNAKHNGYYDITFGDRRERGKYDLEFHVWKWDGNSYR